MNSIKESFDNLPVAVCRPWKSCTGPLITRRSP